MRVRCIRFIQHQWPMPIGHWRQSANGHLPWLLIHRTRMGSRSSRAIQLNSAIQRYTVYSYTALYTIQPLHHPSASSPPPPSSLPPSPSPHRDPRLLHSPPPPSPLSIPTPAPHATVSRCPLPERQADRQAVRWTERSAENNRRRADCLRADTAARPTRGATRGKHGPHLP